MPFSRRITAIAVVVAEGTAMLCAGPKMKGAPLKVKKALAGYC